MRKTYGQPVDYLRNEAGTTGAQLSTGIYTRIRKAGYTHGQLSLIHYVYRQLRTLISPGIFTSPPLAEHYLYPVSTEPIKYCNQMKFKKGI